MPRGRPPKPTALKLIAGDPGKRISAAEMKAFERGEHAVQVRAAKPVTAPKTLTPAGLLIWKEIVGGFPAGTYADTDRHHLAVYCEAVATFQLATAMLAQGYLSTGSTGQTVVSPWLAVQKDAAARIDKMGPSIWATPTAREAMKRGDDKPSVEQEFGGLIQ